MTVRNTISIALFFNVVALLHSFHDLTYSHKRTGPMISGISMSIKLSRYRITNTIEGFQPLFYRSHFQEAPQKQLHL